MTQQADMAGLPAWARPGPDGGYSQQAGAVSGGIIWNLVTSFFQMLGALGQVVLFARLLSAEDFGVYGMAVPLLTIGMMVADGGATYITLRAPKVSHERLSLLFWYASGLGLGLGLLMLATAPLVAGLMGEARVEGAMMALALVLVLHGAAQPVQALTTRCFRNDLRGIAVAGSVTLALIAGVLVAWNGGGYWALVTVMLVRSGALLLLLLLLSGWRPARPRFDRAGLAEVWHLGHAEVSAQLVVFGVREGDRLVVGKLFATAIAGYYALAYMLSVMPLMQVATPLIYVVLPLMAEQRGDAARFHGVTRQMLRLMSWFLLGPCLLAGLLAEPLLVLVLGPDMAPVAEIFPVLVLGAVGGVLTNFASLPFQATDRPDLSRGWNLWMVPGFVLAMLVAVPFGTAQAIGWGVVAANWAALGLRLWAVARQFEWNFAQELAALLAPLLVSAASAFAALALVWALELDGLSALAVGGAGFALLFPLGGWVMFGKEIRALWLRRQQAENKETQR